MTKNPLTELVSGFFNRFDKLGCFTGGFDASSTNSYFCSVNLLILQVDFLSSLSLVFSVTDIKGGFCSSATDLA